MKAVGHILIVLAFFSIFICGCKKSEPQENNGDVSMDLDDIRKDPNAYYDGCVTCTLTVEKKGILSKLIFVKTTFKNETDYPIPVEDRHIIEDLGFDVSLDGKPVEYLGALVSREPSSFPWDYYILPPHATYINSTNLSKYYDLSKRGKYKVKYWSFNCVFLACHVIESEPVEFEIKYWEKMKFITL